MQQHPKNGKLFFEEEAQDADQQQQQNQPSSCCSPMEVVVDPTLAGTLLQHGFSQQVSCNTQQQSNLAHQQTPYISGGITNCLHQLMDCDNQQNSPTRYQSPMETMDEQPLTSTCSQTICSGQGQVSSLDPRIANDLLHHSQVAGIPWVPLPTKPKLTSLVQCYDTPICSITQLVPTELPLPKGSDCSDMDYSDEKEILRTPLNSIDSSAGL